MRDVLSNREHYQDRIFKNSHPEPNSGCWIWTRFVTKEGYPRIKLGDRMYMRAHRASFLAYHGPISEGLFVCHRCDTPICVNPEHLWAGTPLENTRDMIAKGRQVTGIKSANALGVRNLTPEQVRAIRNSSQPAAAIAAQFGLHPRSIWAVRNYRTWRNVK